MKPRITPYKENDLTPEILAVAHKRAMLFLKHINMADYDLVILLESVYLQGCHDMALALINQKEPNLDYQI